MHYPAGCDALKIAPDTRIIIYAANNTNLAEKRETVLHDDVHAYISI